MQEVLEHNLRFNLEDRRKQNPYKYPSDNELGIEAHSARQELLNIHLHYDTHLGEGIFASPKPDVSPTYLRKKCHLKSTDTVNLSELWKTFNKL